MLNFLFQVPFLQGNTYILQENKKNDSAKDEDDPFSFRKMKGGKKEGEKKKKNSKMGEDETGNHLPEKRGRRKPAQPPAKSFAKPSPLTLKSPKASLSGEKESEFRFNN